MVRIWIFAVITAVVFVSSFGCGQQGAGNSPSGSTIAEEETTAHSAQEETTVLQGGWTTRLEGEAHLPRPPDSTLSYGGREIRGSLGSYSWSFSSASAGSGGVDTGYITPPRKQMLTVPSGSKMVFRYGGQRSPSMVQIHVRPLGKKGGSHPSLQAHGSGVERKRTIPADLPPGEYVLQVFVKEQQGDAVYYFRVMVE
jgi:hypothetical protein